MAMKLSTDITIGCDPEFFLKERRTGKHISAHDYVPGTKYEPHRLSKGAVQLDGVACEFNIDPASNAHEFADNIDTTLKEIREIIPDGLDFSFNPAVYFSKQYWNVVPESSKELGCEPDFDWVTRSVKDGVPERAGPGGNILRTAAGHIHIGFCEGADVENQDFIWDSGYIAQEVSSIDTILCRNLRPKGGYGATNRETLRKTLYGTNAYRPKPYGVEVRSPSCAWVQFPQLHGLIFELCKYGTKLALQQDRNMSFYYDLHDIVMRISMKKLVSTQPRMERYGCDMDVVNKGVKALRDLRTEGGYQYYGY